MIVFIAHMYAALDSYYISLVLYCMAYLENLIDYVLAIDEDYSKDPRRNDLASDPKFRRRMYTMIKYHYKVLEYAL